MATIEEHKKLAELIKTKLHDFSTITVDQLTRELELGQQLSFKNGETLFIKMIELFKNVNTYDLFDMPYNILAGFNANLDSARALLDQIRNFSPTMGNPAEQRNALISQLENQYDSYFSSALPILTIGLLNTNELSIERTKLHEALEEIEEEKKKTKKESDKYLGEIKNVLEKARQAALEVGVAQHNMIFKQESEEHQKNSQNWLKWTFVVLFAIVIMGISLLFIKPENEGAYSLIHFTVTKIVILTVMFYALSICSRNYKAHKHNSILNKHRQNALNTFETFSKAAGTDTQTKNAILLEATHTIFSNQQTGYLNNDGESDSPNKIIEIIKSSTSKGIEE